MKYLRLALIPLSLIFLIIIRIREFLYRNEILKSYSSSVPVICLGNIRVGGTGKSQLIITLSNDLISRGYNIAILSRGYKRKTKGFLEVESFDVDKFGDEPVMIKKNLPEAKVYVSENREYGIKKILSYNKPDFILMDDGLQNFSVKKDFAIVLIDKSFLSKNIIDKVLIPAGNLREPKSSVKKYDFIIFNRKFDYDYSPKIDSPNFSYSNYKLKGIFDFDDNEEDTNTLKKSKFVAFCGIAQPESFFKIFENEGILIVGKKIFPDHHKYTVQDLTILIKFVKKLGCNKLITTEKDSVRTLKFKDEFKRAEVFLYYTKIEGIIEDQINLVEKILCLKTK